MPDGTLDLAPSNSKGSLRRLIFWIYGFTEYCFLQFPSYFTRGEEYISLHSNAKQIKEIRVEYKTDDDVSVILYT